MNRGNFFVKFNIFYCYSMTFYDIIYMGDENVFKER